MGAGPILSASPELQKLGYTVSGVVVVDVVEGQLYMTLSMLQLIRRHRSRGFTAHEEYPRSKTHIIQISHRRNSLAVSISLTTKPQNRADMEA